MKRLRILTLCTVTAAFVIFFFKERPFTTLAEGEGLVFNKEWLKPIDQPITPLKDRRPADQTFLTFPEWFLVFSPEEQSNYFTHSTSSSFPYMSHTWQLWESYYIINEQIKDNFPVNKGYHFMIWVIGVSTTAEYAIKALHETIFGRITDTKMVVTDEDKFNASFTKAYVDFIKDRPWYEFDFGVQLNRLWSESSFFAPHFFRKMERKYLLTSELIVKYLYGKLIGFGTGQVYETALPTTAVVLGDSSLKMLPRYHKFNKEVSDLALSGSSFLEIAGNNSAILITIFVPKNDENPVRFSKTIFTQPKVSDSTMKRIAMVVQVSRLSDALVLLNKAGVEIEHVFDY